MYDLCSFALGKKTMTVEQQKQVYNIEFMQYNNRWFYMI